MLLDLIDSAKDITIGNVEELLDEVFRLIIIQSAVCTDYISLPLHQINHNLQALNIHLYQISPYLSSNNNDKHKRTGKKRSWTINKYISIWTVRLIASED